MLGADATAVELPLIEPERPGKETSATMRNRICAHFPADRYAVLFEVRNATGFSQKRRDGYCDALVMGLWPSRGLELWGLEIKVSRADWLRELKTPEKAEEFLPFCHRWFIVAPAEIIQPGELPSTWGHLAPSRSGLRVIVQAPQLAPRPVDVCLLASICRAAADGWQSHPSYLKARDEWQALIDKRVAEATESVHSRMHALIERVADFELASGVALLDHYLIREWVRANDTPDELRKKLQAVYAASDHAMEWRGPEKIGAAVRTVLSGGVEHLQSQLNGIARTARQIAEHAEEAITKQGLQKHEDCQASPP